MRREATPLARPTNVLVACLLILSIFGDRALAAHTSVHSGGTPVAFPPKLLDTQLLRDSADNVNVYASYNIEPAPMGLADYGIGPGGAYQYSTNSSLGVVGINSLSVNNGTGDQSMGVQLNVNLEFYDAGKPYVYWVQDVASLDTSSNTVYFLNNIWNSSSSTANMHSSAVSGQGAVYKYGNDQFYYDGAPTLKPGNYVRLSYPALVELRVNASLDASKQPVVTFEYDDGQGWQEYDSVTFIGVNQLTAFDGFVVNGFNYKPTGFFDSELILGGPGGGADTKAVSSDVQLQLMYWNGHNYQQVSGAYNFGSDTAEGISNVVSGSHYNVATGGLAAQILPGGGSLGRLWDKTTVGIVDLKTSLPSGILEVSNSSFVGANPDRYPFIGGGVTITLNPGTFDLQVFSGGSLATAGQYTLSAGQLLQLKTPLGLIPLTVSYSIVGGGSGYAAPVLTYRSGGAVLTATLSPIPTAFEMDYGSAWSVSLDLPGSGATERWQAPQAMGGLASSAQSEAITYYHQYLEAVNYSVLGGGSGYTPPLLEGQQFGASAVVPLGSSPATVWLDSQTAYSGTNPLPGSGASERWFATPEGGTVTSSGSVVLSYSHQFLLTAAGGSPKPEWFESGTQASLSMPDAYDRSSGTGQRVAGYSVDSGPASTVAPTQGNFSVTLLMDSPHTISFLSVTQYEVTLDPGATASLSFITPPTVVGDKYWYDAGSKLSIGLNGTWGRSAGTGERLVSFSVNGGRPIQVASTGPVSVISLSSISSPQAVATDTTAQYFLDTSQGALSSMTQTPIAGDAGWYDDQTAVTAYYLYSWNATTGSERLNALSYSVDGRPNTLVRQGSGEFQVNVTMTAPHSIGVRPTVQYRLSVAGGFDVTLSKQSPTTDGFYDANSSVAATSAYVGNVTEGSQREALTGYVLDSSHADVPRNETGSFTTPPIVFDTTHTLTFESVEQYYVTFTFRDASGARGVSPTFLLVNESGLKQQGVPGLGLWVDDGTTLSVGSVIWELADVSPVHPSSYHVSSPMKVTVDTRVYPASVRVVDLFGIPVQGASVAATFANGTAVTRSTNSSGVVDLGLIPIGTYHATVSTFGVSASLDADASLRSETIATVDLSGPVIGGMVLASAISIVAVYMVARARLKRTT
jgi:hypothetical protein